MEENVLGMNGESAILRLLAEYIYLKVQSELVHKQDEKVCVGSVCW